MRAYNNALNVVLSIFIDDYNKNKFIPILESDIVSHFYHIWADQYGSTQIHLETRICSIPGYFFDIVIGAVNRDYEKPCIDEPELVVEMKFFVKGFAPQQLRRRFIKVLDDDIPKLATLNKPKENRYIILFDEVGYLRGNRRNDPKTRLENIQNIRDRTDGKIRIILMEKTDILRYFLF